MERKLVNGLIPIGTVCPFKNKCELNSTCRHLGIKHNVPYSCAIARGFDLVLKYDKTLEG